MKQITWMVLGWLVLSFAAQAASFDCAKAGTKVEKLICADAALSKLDEELNAAYKTALQDKKQADTIKQAQKQWMKERNGCADAACVKNVYQTRINELNVMASAHSDTSKQEAKDNSRNGQQYHFRLTKGKGVPVCDAYLERLNTTKYEKPPYCDRPENDAVKGFVRLNRVPLSPADVHDLYPIVRTFMGSANQKNIDLTDMNLQQQLTQTGQFKLSESGSKNLQMNLDGGQVKLWRYGPPIDIDNDSVPDNILMWQGMGVGHVFGVCGQPISNTNFSTNGNQPTVAFIITDSKDRLNVLKTKKIFAHPKGGYRFYDMVDKKWKVSDDFRPIGNAMGIFKYQDIYYFDTFFDGWGDFENKRRTEGTRHKDKNIANTLAVFLHQNGKTRQVCEYLMTDNQTQN